MVMGEKGSGVAGAVVEGGGSWAGVVVVIGVCCVEKEIVDDRGEQVGVVVGWRVVDDGSGVAGIC